MEVEADIANPFVARAIDAVSLELGSPIRSTEKVDAWNVRLGLGIV
jgi:hypothetical protein